MKIEAAPPRKFLAIRIEWFLRLARQRRWFHESLFRAHRVTRKPEDRRLQKQSRGRPKEPIK